MLIIVVVMFFRSKKSGKRNYLQIVESYRENGKPRQQVIATIGRIEDLQESGKIDALLCSGAKFARKMAVLSEYKKKGTTKADTKSIGPSLVFEKLWKETEIRSVISSLVEGRRFGFDVERAIFSEVLHRLFYPGSDRDGMKWKETQKIDGAEGIMLHHAYRAMAWLGEELEGDRQEGGTPFAPRCTKDVLEEDLFSRRKNLFSSLDIVFFDTTSIYFEGAGGENLGKRGNNKDHRPDLNQIVVGAILDDEGRPVCSEMWHGNTTDVKTLIPVTDRLRKRFGVDKICIVADRGMISAETIRELESGKRGWKYILGVRMRIVKEVRDEVLSRSGRYRIVNPPRQSRKDPSPLKVKEVVLRGRRYIVCHNEEQERKDREDRAAIIAALEEKLKNGDKSLVGNKGYRKYVKSSGIRFEIDYKKVKEEEQFDGKWVLTTNLDIPSEEVALKYKQLWMVENFFRTIKSIFETRPVYHKYNATIRGHVACSFLSLVLMKELQERIEYKGMCLEWKDIIRDLDSLKEVELTQDGKRFIIRSESKGVCGKVFNAVGVSMPPTVKQLE